MLSYPAVILKELGTKNYTKDKVMIRKQLFRLARSRFSAVFIGWAFAHFSWLMPVQRRAETADFIIFRHPVPFWERHWLLVPKRAVPNLLTLDLQTAVSQRLLFAMLRGMSQLHDIETILVNGGDYQDVPQLHFHLAAGAAKNGSQLGQTAGATPAKPARRLGLAHAYPHPQPAREFHWMLVSETTVSPFTHLVLEQPETSTALLDLFRLAQQLVQQHQLSAYTLLWRPSQEPFPLHLLGQF